MPMIRDTPPPLPAETLRELRATLPTTYGHRLVNQEGRLVLAVRVPGEVPDRDRDLPFAADVVPEDEVAQARDVLFIADDKLVRIDPIPLRDAVRERVRADAPVSKEVRRGLKREYGATLFQSEVRRGVLLAARLPKASVRDATPEDLAALRAALEPILAQPQAARAAMCYLVADNDYRRCPPEEFLRVVRGEVALRPPRVNTYAVAGDGRGRNGAVGGSFTGSPFGMLVSATLTTDARLDTQKRKAAPAPAPAAPAPAPSSPEPPSPLPPAAPAAPAAPLRIPAAPAPVDPAPPLEATSAPPAHPVDALVGLSSQFTARGFEVLAEVADLGLALAAHHPDGKRVIVQRVPEGTPEGVKALAARCQELEADVALLVADTLAPGTWLEAAGTPVEVLPAAQAATWTL